MLRMLATNWWIVGLRGITTLLFGFGAILFPGLTLAILITMFGVYTIIDGLFTIVMGVWGGKDRATGWFTLLLEGLVRIAAGVVAIIWPELTSLTLVIIIATWAIITGIIEIIMAIRLRKEIEGEWMLGLGGFLSILLGVVLFARPGIGVVAGVSLIGFYAILFGALLIVFAIQMQKRKKSLERLIEGVREEAVRE